MSSDSKDSNLHIKFTSRAFDKLESQCSVITLFSDERPIRGAGALIDWRLNGRLSRILKKNQFGGKFKEVLLMPSEGRVKSREILVFGLGNYENFNSSSMASFSHYLLEKLAQKKVKDFNISLSDLITDRFEWRNTVRLLVSKMHDFPAIETIRLCETEDCVKDAKRRHMDFGVDVAVSFETQGY